MIDLDDALVIRASRKPSFREGLLSAAAAGGSAGILVFSFMAKPELIAVAVLAASLAFLYAMRKKEVELRITMLEFVLRGRVGDDFGSTRSVRSADIQWLEFQEDTTGPETSHHPGGLYAVLGRRNICLLPDVDERQTALIIARIAERFPGFRRQWESASPFGKRFTSLRLNEPE